MISNQGAKGDPPATYDPVHFERLAAVEDRHFWFRARNRVIEALAAQIAATLPAGQRVLEVGCGTGNVLRVLERAFPDAQVVGMDLFSEGLSHARKRCKCSLLQADVRKPPFSKPFHLVGAFDVIEHLPDDLSILRDLRKLLVPGGYLILTVPAHEILWSCFDIEACHYRRYTTSDLAAKLIQTGYRVEYLTEYMASIFPLVWASRKFGDIAKGGASGRTKSDNSTTQALKVVPCLNGFLSFILRSELPLLLRRRHIPFGTSLLAIARPDPQS